MITGAIKSQIDQIWNAFLSHGGCGVGEATTWLKMLCNRASTRCGFARGPPAP